MTRYQLRLRRRELLEQVYALLAELINHTDTHDTRIALRDAVHALDAIDDQLHQGEAE